MDIETKIELVKKKPTEEIVTEQDLREIFETYAHPQQYIGFEISGMVHVAAGLSTALKINDLIQAGCKCMIWLADYHAWINGKLGGDLKTIQKFGEGYFKHAFISLGLDEEKVEYKMPSKVYDNDFWADVLRITKDTTLKRMLRCTTIMGREENEALPSSAIVYPAMQASDILRLDVQIAHAGMDQRKVHMLLREVAPKFNKKFVALHTHLLPGLQGPGRMETELDAKMSKSKPDSSIFLHDPVEEIQRKVKKAHCPPKEMRGNPIYEIAEYLILRDRNLKIERPAKFGGDLEVNSEELETVYSKEELHPMDLKNAVSRELVDMLKPCRDYFDKHKEYLKQLEEIKITR